MASPSLSKIFRPVSRTNAQAAVLWGVTAGTGAIYLVQPFDWIRQTFFEKSEPEQK